MPVMLLISLTGVTISDGLKQPVTQRIFEFFYPVHTGKLGLWYRMLLSVFGLALAVLCVFGMLSFLKRT